MPPHLRLGLVVGKRVISTPEPLINCACSECIIYDYYDRESNRIISGQRLTRSLFNDHKKRDRQQLAAAKHFLRQSTASFVSQIKSGQRHGAQEFVLNADEAKVEDTTSPVDVDLCEVKADLEQYWTDEESETTSEFCRVPRRRRKRRFLLNSTASHRHRLLTQLGDISDRLAIITSSTFRESLQRTSLVFTKNPDHNSPTSLVEELPSLELDSVSPFNQQFMQHEEFLRNSMAFLQLHRKHPTSRLLSHRLSKIILIVESEQERTLHVKKECWRRLRIESSRNKDQIIHTSPHSSSLRHMGPIPCLIYLMAATFYFLADLSLSDVGFFLSSVVLLVKLSIRGSTRAELANVLPSIPADFRTVVKSLQIDPVYKSVICCPSCFSTYTFETNDSNTIPEFCEYQSTKLSKSCGRRLRKKAKSQQGTTSIKPVREYSYQDLRHWIGRMYSRPDIEEHMDRANIPGSPTEKMNDIWDGSVLKHFLGPDGRHFMDKPEQEGRLIFGLNMDGFNPYGNKEAGKVVSICGIYLVCFNLPPELRYKAENVFLLGIVPGPREPSTLEVNHLIKPVVDDLLKLWFEGIYLTSTHKYPHGRHVKGALIPLICDLPAARRVAGLGSHSSGHFCSECLLLLRNINELDRNKWSPRCWEDHVIHASKWLEADSEYQREKIFRDHGIRWSQLLRLPYWDPTKFVVIDSMHGFYLRLFHRHIRQIWGMDYKLLDGEGDSLLGMGLEEEEIAMALHVFQHGRTMNGNAAYPLEGLSKEQLQFLCREHGLHYGGRKPILIKNLTEYRISHQFDEQIGTLTGANTNSVTLNVPSEQLAMTPSLTPLSVIASSTSGIDQNAHIASNRKLLTSTQIATLYRMAKTELMKQDKEDLVDLCMAKLGGKRSTYKKSKKDLVTLLHDMRVRDGIIDSNGRIIQRNTGKGGNSQIDSEELTEEGRERLAGIYQSGSKAKVSSLRKHFLAVLCVMKLQGTRDYKDYQGMKKDELEDLLNEARFADGIVDENGELVDEEQLNSKQKDQAILGRQTLDEIRRDMDQVKLPSWFSRAPKHPGEINWGKLKADEWKAFCTVNLPITLTRLWGTLPKADKRHKMLENFLHLVTAAKIANKRTVSATDIALYEKHITLYTSGFLKLYPFANITPYQHLSLHFSTHLQRFGPTHSWRCFAFERFNGIIQGLPTNNKFGELEKTLFMRFCRMQNLRSLFTEAALPNELKSVVEMYEKKYQVTIQGTLSEDDTVLQFQLKKDSTDAIIELCATLNSWLQQNDPKSPPSTRFNTLAATYVARHGQRFEGGTHPNSYVIFRQSDQLKAGRIVKIASYSGRHRDQPKFFALIRQYNDLHDTDIQHDYFRPLPEAAGYLSYSTLTPQITLVPLSDITSHFAASFVVVPSIAITCIHVLPLRM